MAPREGLEPSLDMLTACCTTGCATVEWSSRGRRVISSLDRNPSETEGMSHVVPAPDLISHVPVDFDLSESGSDLDRLSLDQFLDETICDLVEQVVVHVDNYTLL